MSHKRNKKLIINVGIPGAGKTTRTRAHLEKNPNTVSVSRDDFRYGLRNSGVTEPKIEDLITELVDMTILKSLSRGCDVIVDATNLKASYINHFIELVKYKADVQFEIFEISLEKAIERDKNRERSVGEHVIKKMYKQYKDLMDSFVFQPVPKQPDWKNKFESLQQDKRLPEAVMFDIDGNLAEMCNRSPYDWDKVDGDDVIHIVAEQIKFHKDAGRTIIIISGRDEAAREKTEYWLNFYNLHFDHLFMRPKDDMRKDYVIKKEIFNSRIFNRFNALCVYDDRISVVKKCWYDLGIFCFTTNQGLHEF